MLHEKEAPKHFWLVSDTENKQNLSWKVDLAFPA